MISKDEKILKYIEENSIFERDNLSISLGDVDNIHTEIS